MKDKERIVLDSYAMLCFFYAESGSEKVKNVLLNAREGSIELLMNWFNIGEVYYSIYRELGKMEAENAISLMKSYPIRRIDVTGEIALAAARLKATSSIAYADCFAAATAKLLSAVVTTGDPEFKVLEPGIKVNWLS